MEKKTKTILIDWKNKKIQYIQGFPTNYQLPTMPFAYKQFGNDQINICSEITKLEEEKDQIKRLKE